MQTNIKLIPVGIAQLINQHATLKVNNMRSRTKECHICKNQTETLYRCRYTELKEWLFLCGKCLTEIKAKHEKTYQYGGTWKSKKW